MLCVDYRLIADYLCYVYITGDYAADVDRCIAAYWWNADWINCLLLIR